MRGIDSKAMLAQARFTTDGDAQVAKRIMATAEFMAYREGVEDAIAGVRCLPVKLADEPKLAERWCAGQNYYLRKFSEEQWRNQCEMFAADAICGCGQSYDLYVDRFSNRVDRGLHLLHAQDQTEAIEIAREFGYETAAERLNSSHDDHGYCHHGIQFNHCPFGCEASTTDDDFVDHAELEEYYGVVSEANAVRP
jgi:hypothetical protein